jgi:hypothetical protein
MPRATMDLKGKVKSTKSFSKFEGEPAKLQALQSDLAEAEVTVSSFQQE